MAAKQIKIKDISITNPCPRCGSQLLTIEGQLTRWVTCPKCRYKRLEGKSNKDIVVRSLKDRDGNF